jgi:hypothetical protein
MSNEITKPVLDELNATLETLFEQARNLPPGSKPHVLYCLTTALLRTQANAARTAERTASEAYVAAFCNADESQEARAECQRLQAIYDLRTRCVRELEASEADFAALAEFSVAPTQGEGQ